MLSENPRFYGANQRLFPKPPKADIAGRQLDVRFVPQADIRDLCHNNRPRRIFVEQPDGRSPARLSIGLRHTIGAAAKYSQFCLVEG
jgi:hypothetical protein